MPLGSWSAAGMLFGTYRFAELQDEQKVSAEMGNSPAELREHYAELADPQEAAQWFSVLRVSPVKKTKKQRS